MALWPFSRRRKRGRKPVEDETTGTSPQPHQQPHNQQQHQSLTRPHTPPAQTSTESYIPIHGSNVSSGLTARRDSKRRKRDTAQTHNGNEPSNFSHSSIPAAPSSSLPTQVSHPNPSFLSGDTVLRQQASVDTFLSHKLSTNKSRLHTEMSQTNFAGSLHHVPTLRGKRNTTDSQILRRRSDRRKRNDPVREQEIKDMTNLPWDPRQSQVDTAKSSNRHLSDPVGSYPVSGNQFVDPCDSYTYKVNAFDVLTPRPFVRPTGSPRATIPQSSDISRSPTTRGKGRKIKSDKSAGTKRVEGLADSMDAGDLRELMERDRRRKLTKSREFKDKSPQKHNSTRRDRPEERGSPKAKPRDQSSVNNGSVCRQSDKMERSPSPAYSASWLRDASKESFSESKKEPAGRTARTEIRKNGNVENVPPTHLHTDDATIFEAVNEPPASPIANNKQASLSASPLPVIPQGSTSDVSRDWKPPENNGKLARSWTSIFRRGTLRRKMSVPQKKNSSEFSVTSRESMPRNNQSHPIAIPGAVHRTTTTDNQSTRSKFTEHLDESPMAHGSRLYPAESSSAIRDDAYSYSNRMSIGTGTNAAEHQSMSVISTNATPEPREGHRSSGANSPDTRPNSLFLAQSLASIDSEGSWLSGKPSRRISQTPLNHIRGSAGSTRERLDDTVESGEEEENAMSEEYFGSLPVPEEEEEEEPESDTPKAKRAVANHVIDPEANGLNEGEATTWHDSVGKRPLVVNPHSRAKSNEGLFTNFLDSEDETNVVENETSPVEESEIGRATSVDLGRGHVRHISAGSARLLHLGRQTSSKRNSAASMPSGEVSHEPTS